MLQADECAAAHILRLARRPVGDGRRGAAHPRSGTRIFAIGFAIDMLVAIVLARRRMGAKFTSTEGGGWVNKFFLFMIKFIHFSGSCARANFGMSGTIKFPPELFL